MSKLVLEVTIHFIKTMYLHHQQCSGFEMRAHLVQAIASNKITEFYY